METILNIASDYITKKLEGDLPQGTIYHNLLHTTETVKYAKIIGENSGINADQFEMLLLSAWFHDIGYIEKYNDHEEISAELCREFLAKHNYPSIKLEVIMRIILSTKLTREPANLLEKIICDADIAYIGEREFYIRSQVLRIEWNNMLGKNFSDLEWIKTNIDFLLTNKFHTEYAKLLFEKQRKRNLMILQRKLKSTRTKSGKQYI